jgi:hypothetical protein
MSPRTIFIMVMLGLLLVANILMLSGFTNYPTAEGFADYMGNTPMNDSEPFEDFMMGNNPDGFANPMEEQEETEGFMNPMEEQEEEGFADYLANPAPSGDKYESIGAYDNVVKKPAHGLSNWRGPAPNEPLLGPDVEVGPDNLFIFKNNQCKPECCGASFSCGSGCVCTTPGQRELINSRGGNRTGPVDL